MKEAPESEQKRVLVLCVDRDGDLGAKAGVKTPVVGREDNISAAVSLALKDPEEPDANAMFEAVRIYDRLKAENRPEEVVEVATISGSELGGISADRKVVVELNDLLHSFEATEVILVSDGYSDEAVLPVVQSRVPVSAVEWIPQPVSPKPPVSSLSTSLNWSLTAGSALSQIIRTPTADAENAYDTTIETSGPSFPFSCLENIRYAASTAPEGRSTTRCPSPMTFMNPSGRSSTVNRGEVS